MEVVRNLLSAAVLVIFAACGGTATVDVTQMNPVPRAMNPRTVETLRVLDQRPSNGVAVFFLHASGDGRPALEVALREKAASLGCDGILVTERKAPSRDAGVMATGQLTTHHEPTGSKVEALCIVLPDLKPAGC